MLCTQNDYTSRQYVQYTNNIHYGRFHVIYIYSLQVKSFADNHTVNQL